MEPADLAEARQKAEAAELEALVAEADLRIWYAENEGQMPYLGLGAQTLAQLTVRANLLRSLAFRASLEYLAKVERQDDPAWQQAEQSPR